MSALACFELEAWEEELLRKAFPSETIITSTQPLTKELAQTMQQVESIVVFIYSAVTREVIESLPNLKLVCTMSTGYDHIDLAACQEKGVTVCSVPSYGDRTVAQHTFMLLLALTRKLVASVQEVRAGRFIPTPELRGTDINGRVMGVIGTGKIGRNTIKYSRGFGMDVVAYDPYPDTSAASDLGFRYVSLDELYSISDFVSVHVPLIPSTKHLINHEAICKMKQGVVILNTSRGGIIDTEALYEGLLSGKVGGAGLDVLEEETSIKEERQLLSQRFKADADYKTMVLNHLLIQHPNVIVTPHNAFNSVEALHRIVNTTIENVQAFRSGHPQNIVGKK